MLGRFDGAFLSHSPRVSDPRFGTSTARVPFVVKFELDEERRAPFAVGKLAKDRYFEGYPAFTCNVVFSCGPIIRGHGEYSNPNSVWCNAFFGAWEVVAKKSLWEEPFGYRDGEPFLEDILRLGLADWNLFSSYLYGSPTPSARADLECITSSNMKYLGRHKVEGLSQAWDLVEGLDISIASPISLERRWPWTPFWRFAFGRPVSVTRATSRLRIKLIMCHDMNDSDTWTTWVCGATANETSMAQDASDLLEVQFASIEDFLKMHHPRLGFPEDFT